MVDDAIKENRRLWKEWKVVGNIWKQIVRHGEIRSQSDWQEQTRMVLERIVSGMIRVI